MLLVTLAASFIPLQDVILKFVNVSYLALDFTQMFAWNGQLGENADNSYGLPNWPEQVV